MPLLSGSRSTGLFTPRRAAAAAGAFTLIELLTVITIIAILATLLMTTFSSVKRRAREVVCTSNLRQIGIALHLYLDDFAQRPPDLQTLVSSKYLGAGKVLTCPADRSVARSTTTSEAAGLAPSKAVDSGTEPPSSYQHPLGWSDDEWNRLMRASTRAGVVVCTWHDIRPRTLGGEAGTTPTDGLILRGQLDGTVVRRQIFSTLVEAPPALVRNAGPVNSAGAAADASTLVTPTPPWELFSDESPP